MGSKSKQTPPGWGKVEEGQRVEFFDDNHRAEEEFLKGLISDWNTWANAFIVSGLIMILLTIIVCTILLLRGSI